MNKSETINELATALSKAQAKLKGAKQDSTNPFYKCKYADLSSVWDACREPLTNNGLSVTQTMAIGANGECIIETTLFHTSGQWINSQLQMPVEIDPQKLGKEITYGRRYALAAIVGVCPEDDDAESTVEHKSQQTVANKVAPTQPQTGATKEQVNINLCSEPQRRKIFASSKAMGYSEEQIRVMALSKFNIESTKDLTKKQASDLIEAIEKGEGLED